MERWIRSCLGATALLGLLAAGEAGATLVKNGKDKAAGAASGGVEVAPQSSKVRVQCWQDGRKIIDESDLSVVSLSIANQLNGLRLRRTGGPDGGLTVVTQQRTACLLAPHE